MTNPFDYLYYKIYNALSYISGGGNPIRHYSAMGAILLINILTIYLFITGTYSVTFAALCG